MAVRAWRARVLWDTAPEWRREEKLDAVARWLLGPGADVHRMYLISNHGPVVIAHGAVSDSNNKWMRINLSLNDYVEHGDHVWGCIVYDGWPSEADLRELPPEDKVRRIHFPVKTVAELRNARPWEKRKD